MSLIPDEVRVIYFDAVGTLLFPAPSVGEAYHRVGRRYGTQRTLDEVKRGFGAAFAAQERLDAQQGHRTSEARERERWLAIVRDVLPDVHDPARCFDELYDHFADPIHWRLDDNVTALLHSLTRRGLKVGLASNFDDRLFPIVAAHPVLRDHLAAVVVSSVVGWRKPASAFFAAVCHTHAPDRVMYVGDDRVNDYDGARAAGLHALLLDDTITLSDLI